MPPPIRSAVPISFSPRPSVLRVGHVVGGDLLDPLVADLVEVHGRRERQPRQDRHLRRRVLAGDVVGRVGLGVAERLRLAQRLVVGDPRGRHLGEDVVRRPVDDPVHALDLRRRQRLLQHADDRHDARHRALEAQLHAVLARRRPQLLAVVGEQLLVGRHDVLAGPHRPQHVLARRLEPAHQLDDQVRALEDLLERPARARQHAGELRPRADDRLDRLGALGQQRLERRADRAVAEQADLKRPGQPGPPVSRAAPPPAPRRPRRG